MKPRYRKLFDWHSVQASIDAGHGYTACHKQFGIAHATWMRAIVSGDLIVDLTAGRYANARKRFDWVAIQEYYDAGASIRACMAHFGFSSNTWAKAARRGSVKARHAKWSLEEALATSRSRITIKRHLLKAGILENRCDWCGLTSWRGRPISIQIDHINGVRDDHRVENLRMLCPNCHSQTETFAAKNIKSNGNPSSSNGRTAASEVAYGGSSPSLGA
jgi:hypothetical protein